jgi:hypothetical protein
MWSQSDGLDHLTDGSRFNKFSRLNGCSILESFAVHDRVNPFGLFLHFFHFRQLFQRRDSRFIHHKILSVPHGANPKRRPISRN